jgi:hypothetical protein
MGGPATLSIDMGGSSLSIDKLLCTLPRMLLRTPPHVAKQVAVSRMLPPRGAAHVATHVATHVAVHAASHAASARDRTCCRTCCHACCKTSCRARCHACCRNKPRPSTTATGEALVLGYLALFFIFGSSRLPNMLCNKGADTPTPSMFNCNKQVRNYFGTRCFATSNPEKKNATLIDFMTSTNQKTSNPEIISGRLVVQQAVPKLFRDVLLCNKQSRNLFRDGLLHNNQNRNELQACTLRILNQARPSMHNVTATSMQRAQSTRSFKKNKQPKHAQRPEIPKNHRTSNLHMRSNMHNHVDG